MIPPRQTSDRVLRRDASVRRRTSTASRFLRTGVLLLAALAAAAPAAGQALERRLVVVVPEATLRQPAAC